MSRRFLRADGDYLEITSALVSTPPFTMACWFTLDDLTLSTDLMAIATDASNNQQHALIADGAVAGDFVVAFTQTTSSVKAKTTTGITQGQWHHACGVWAAATDRRAFIDGGSKGTNTTNRSPSGMNRTQIGQSENNTNRHSGLIAEAAIWNVALTDGEVATLAAGISPLRVRPSALVGYWPLFGTSSPENDYSGKNNDMTLVATPTQDRHAPVGPMFGFDMGWHGGFAGAAPPVVTIPYTMAQSGCGL